MNRAKLVTNENKAKDIDLLHLKLSCARYHDGSIRADCSEINPLLLFYCIYAIISMLVVHNNSQKR